MLISFVFVPLASPRLANGDCVEAMALNPSIALGALATFAGSALGSEDDKVIVHYVEALLGVTVGDEFVFLCACMDQKHIGIPFSANRNGLTRANGDHVRVAIEFLLKIGQDKIEQARVRGAGRRRETEAAGGTGGLRRLGRPSIEVEPWGQPLGPELGLPSAHRHTRSRRGIRV